MRGRKLLALVAFPGLFVAIAVVAILFRRPLWEMFSTTERLRRLIASTGAVAPLVFVGVQALQVIVFFIPGEIPQVVGGYLFGLWRGTLLSLAGIAAGSAFSFAVSRALGVPFVYALFDRREVDRLRGMVEVPRARLSFFLLFLIPGIPKDVLCYAAGLSSIRLLIFLPFSAVGRLPGIVGSALMGEAAADRRWFLAGSVLLLAVVLFVIGFLFRERVQGLLERLSRRRVFRTDRSAGGSRAGRSGGGTRADRGTRRARGGGQRPREPGEVPQGGSDGPGSDGGGEPTGS
jgi:uncharacterized membrane protein YdjX (TVP38/TMEM64 family)